MDHAQQTSATAMLASLTADEIQRRLSELNGEAQALRVLLRAARARERHQQLGRGERREAQPRDREQPARP